MTRNKKIVSALKEIKLEKKTESVLEKAPTAPSEHYPSFTIQTKFVPPLADAELDQQVRMVIEGKLSARDDYKSKDAETGKEEETSNRTIEVHRVGVSKIGKALKS